MKPYRSILVLFFALFVFACSTTPKFQSPFDTLRAYTIATKKKDATSMKLLLSAESLKMHEEQAKQQNVALDDIILRETLIGQGQTSLEYRNEKIEGDQATIEVKNSFGQWDTIPFVREQGLWKIDKKGFANQMQQQIEQQNNQELDDIINQGRIQ